MCENHWLALYKVKAETMAYATEQIATETEIYVQ